MQSAANNRKLNHTIKFLVVTIMIWSSTLQAEWTRPVDANESGALKAFKDCGELEQWIESKPLEFLGALIHRSGGGRGGMGGLGGAGGGSNGGGGGGGGTPRESKPQDFTRANNQIDNVDEDDFVKSSGNYLYQITDQTLQIVKIWPAAQTKNVASIQFQTSARSLLLLSDNRLLVFLDHEEKQVDAKASISGREDLKSVRPEHRLTAAQIVDVSNPSAPKLAAKYILSGDFRSARLLPDGTVVSILGDRIGSPEMFSQSSISQIITLNKLTLLDWLGKNSRHAASNCRNFYSTGREETSYFVRLIRMDFRKGQIFETSFFGDSYETLTTGQSLYTHSGEYPSYSTSANRSHLYTYINKFSVPKSGPLTLQASGRFPGRLINSFAMDEFAGYLRIAVHRRMSEKSSQDINQVFVIQAKGPRLALIGKSPPLAPGEDLKSVRFQGNLGYVVTFRKVDPLFVIDLKNPSSPKMAGSLKVPGYSTYMHPIDKQRLLTMGRSTNDKTGQNVGLRISLFDVSDIQKPKLLDALESNVGRKSAANHDHLAFTYSPSRQLLAIPESDHYFHNDNWSLGEVVSELSIFNIKNDKIIFSGRMGMSVSPRDNEITRSLFNEQFVYALSSKAVLVADATKLPEVVSSVYYVPFVPSFKPRSDDVSVTNDLVVTGGLTPQEVMVVARSQLNGIRLCYQQVLQLYPSTSGGINVTFKISLEGSVVQVKSSSGQFPPVVQDCVARRISRWNFPKPRGGAIASVALDIRFGQATEE